LAEVHEAGLDVFTNVARTDLDFPTAPELTPEPARV
jgi:hypothetical protein